MAVVRFTPTRVGTTNSASSSARPPAVHPHACGDDLPYELGDLLESGSPPRVWGRLATDLVVFGRARVHPHACGDDYDRQVFIVARLGSPPRVWGRRIRRVPLLGWSRFTPTRVGTTLRQPESHQQSPVHPHACGDDAIRRSVAAASGGSPPRVWGRRGRRGGEGVRGRFTPTRVGTTIA